MPDADATKLRDTEIQPGCQFASDNAAGVCPEAWDAMTRANAGYAKPYGDDQWTAECRELVRELFEIDCEIFFTFNGTAANSLAISSMCQSYHSVVCASIAHLETDECGAPEFFTGGAKLQLAAVEYGRIRADSLSEIIRRRGDVHFPKVKALSLTQSTEVGTVYSSAAIRELSAIAHGARMGVHMDGARLANAIVAEGVSPKEMTWAAGVDVVSFGGTKNGLPIGEIVIFFDKDLASEFEYRCKQAGQLASKMRYLSAGWVGLLRNGVWLTHAAHANQCASRLAESLQSIPGVELAFPQQANAVFVNMPKTAIERLRRDGWTFYTFVGCGGGRFMCSWRTTTEEIDALVNAVRTACAAAG
ncbi:MAG: threonine aldolase [Pirellulaceae bacterium]|jgi:threonine aldolase